jgi:hypothetical protein
MSVKETTLYTAGTAVLAITALVALVPPRNFDNGNKIPAPIISGTQLPAMLNLPDTQCGEHRRCTDAEFNILVEGLQRRWAITPEWVRFNCVENSSFASMELCIRKQTGSWLAQNPNRQAPWMDPKNLASTRNNTVE